MAHAGAAGGLFSLALTFPLLWLALGSLFVMVALRDRGGAARRPEQRQRVTRLPNLSEHPLRQVSVTLAASKAARRKARERAADEGAGDPPPSGPARRRPRPAASRGRHMRRVV